MTKRPLVVGPLPMGVAKRYLIAVAFSVMSLLATAAAQSTDAVIKDLLQTASFKKASAFIDEDYDRFVRELITLTEIPAPPFKEMPGRKYCRVCCATSG